MPKRHRKSFNFQPTAGSTQYSGSLSPSQSVRQALPALPGRILQKEEAALFQGVTEAPAEPKTGAIPSGPINIEFDVGTSRLGGMGRLTDGFSHLASNSNIPLRTNNNNNTNDLADPVSDRGHGQEDLVLAANPGTDPTTNGLSEMEIDERQEGATETTNPDNAKHII